MTLTALALFGVMLIQVAPTPKPPISPAPDPPAPTLTATEQVAIASIVREQAANQQEAQRLQQEAAAVIADVARSHPGYHLGPDGKLVPDAKPDPPPPTPAPRPKPPAQ